ncbi:MAG: ion transporter [Gammaproteobacteria bacterium]|nr:ion transporter [Gammaproteobacteria bacterium]
MVADLSLSWRQRLTNVVESTWIERFIVALIVINAITLGLETSPDIMATAGIYIKTIDSVILSIFVIEITLRIIGHGWRFFTNPWGVFDFFVVSIALVPAGSEYAVLRALRVLRILRLLSMVPQMRKVVSTLLAAIPGLSSIILVLLLIFYVFSVMATNLFAADYPDWFGTIGQSMYTLFQIMTLESWSMGIVRPLMETHPYAWVFFVPFILIATFTMLNLFMAIIVNAMQSQHEKETEKTVAAVEQATTQVDKHLHSDIERIESELKAIRLLIEKQNDSR